MEKDDSKKINKLKCVKKLNTKNVNRLLNIFEQQFCGMQKEINMLYIELIETWNTITDIERKNIDEILNAKIDKSTLTKESAEKYVWVYIKVKELLKSKLKYIEIAGMKVMNENLKVKNIEWKPEILMDKNWIKYKESKTWDIWEYFEGDLKWEQLFTRDAAIRESEKQWLMLPNEEEWWKIIKSIWWKWVAQQSQNTIKKLKIKMCGNYSESKGFDLIKEVANFWIQEDMHESAWFILFKDNFCHNLRNHKTIGNSVRCIIKK